MRKLALILVLFAPALPAQNWGTMPVDVLFQMNTSTPGTTMTTTIANAGTVAGSSCTAGTNCFWNTVTDFTVGANQGICSNLGAISVNGGSTYAANTLNYNNMAHNDADNNTDAWFNYTGSTTIQNVSAGGCITMGFPAQGNGTDWDLSGIWDNLGHYVEMQANPSCPSFGEFGMRLESDYNGTTTHSTSCISIVPQKTYLWSLNYDMVNGIGTLYLFTPNGTQIGTVTVPAVSGNHWNQSGGTNKGFQIGNNEAGNNSGTYTEYQNTVIDWTHHANPLFWTNSSPQAGVLAPGRSINWVPGIAGLATGTVPDGSWTQCGSTIAAYGSSGSPASPSTINSAISSCGTDQYVLLGNGTFYLNACINFNGKSNVVLRGGGANNTDIIFSGGSGCLGASNIGIAITSGDNNWKNAMSNGPVTWTAANYLQGQNTITLASVPNLVVGNPIILDMLNSTTDAGGILIDQSTSGSNPFTSPGSAGPYSTSGNAGGAPPCPSASSDANCYSQEQIVLLTQCDGNTTVGHACSSGSNITISPGLHMPNWNTNTIRAWWATSPCTNDGIENLKIDNTNNSGALGVEIFNCTNSWVKGIASADTGEAHIQLQYTSHDTVRDSYFFLTQGGSTTSYGVECYSGSDELLENNIFQAVVSPTLFETCTGSVSGYNYDINNYYPADPGYNINFHGDHSVGSDTDLTEGNIANKFEGDDIHGTHNFQTYDRNVYTGPLAACTSSNTSVPYSLATYAACNSGLEAVDVYAFSRFYSLIGNVLGTTGTNTTRETTTSSTSAVINITMGNGSVPTDAVAKSTFMDWGNVDSATGFSAGGVFSCTNIGTFPASGTATSSLVASQFPYYNYCPASNALPPSFYYSSTPSWWPSGEAWPPIGPDVTGGNLVNCTSGTYSGAVVPNSSYCAGGSSSAAFNGTAYSTPAMNCYYNTMGGNPYGTSAMLSFNAASCYAPAGAVTLSPATQNFGVVGIGSSSSPVTFTVKNNSSASATSITPTTVGGNAGEFTIGSNTCGTLGTGGATCTFTVTFTPAATGSRSTTLSVSYSGGDGASPQTASLSGTGATQAGTPTFSPSEGTYSSTQNVTISTSSGGAIICWNTSGSPRTNGTTGCSVGTLYSGAVPVSVSETLYAVAGGTGYVDSIVGSAAYTITGSTSGMTFGNGVNTAAGTVIH